MALSKLQSQSPGHSPRDSPSELLSSNLSEVMDMGIGSYIPIWNISRAGGSMKSMKSPLCGTMAPSMGASEERIKWRRGGCMKKECHVQATGQKDHSLCSASAPPGASSPLAQLAFTVSNDML